MLYLYSTGVLFFSPTSTFTSVHIFDEFSTFTPIHFLCAASLLVSLPSRSEFMVAITTVASHFTVSRTRSTWRNVCKGWEDRSFCSLLSLFRSAACLPASRVSALNQRWKNQKQHLQLRVIVVVAVRKKTTPGPTYSPCFHSPEWKTIHIKWSAYSASREIAPARAHT